MIRDHGLALRAVANAGVGHVRRRTRAGHVGALFGVGSSRAAALCWAANVDPGEEVGGLPPFDEHGIVDCPCCGHEVDREGF